MILNLTSERISKYNLIKIFNDVYQCNKTIIPFEKPIIDRSLFKINNEKLVLIRKKWKDQILETKNFVNFF